MDLPIVPSFFRRIDVYQRLIDAEHEIATKDIWDSEKAALMWAAGPDHKFVGSYISKENIEDLLKREFNARLAAGDASAQRLIDFIVGFSKEVMEALVMRGFAIEKPIDSSQGAYKIRINPDGFLAGKILIETNSLKSAWRYKLWIGLWWIILGLALIILLIQAWPVLGPIWHFAEVSLHKLVQYLRHH
ncbi:MAG: hypothetical protein WCO52_04265 [bacterium]